MSSRARITGSTGPKRWGHEASLSGR